MMTKRLLYIGNKLAEHGKTPTAIENLGPLLASEGFKVTYASSIINKPLRFLDMIAKTLLNARSSNYVLIDTYSTANFWYAIAVSQLCRLLSAKYIPILHGGNLPYRLFSSPKFSKMIFANAHLLVAPSQYLANAFENKGFAPIEIIPNPIAIEKFPFKERLDFRPSILWLRSLSNIYNPELALEVLRLVTEKFPVADMIFIGPDNENLRPGLKLQAEKTNLSVAFTGMLSKEEWVALSRKFDIFLNTSNVDNMPASLVETAAVGLAIVSTNVGGVPYLFENGKNAVLADPNDAQALANAIIKCCKNPVETAERTKMGRLRAEDFRWKIVGQSWKRILH